MRKMFLPVGAARLGALGAVPFAPGTVATVVAGIPGAFVLSRLPGPVAWMLLVIVLSLSCYVAHEAEKALGRTDPQEVVIDEFAGFLVAMFGLPLTPWSLLSGVLLFRLFDIWKPWPIRMLQSRLKGGFGIVMDDVAAGVAAHLLVRAGLALFPLTVSGVP